jgi:hypothetical protein
MKSLRRLTMLLGLLALILLITAGCATAPKPPPEDFYVALAESSARWSAYMVSRNNLAEAAVAKTYLAGIDVETILTYKAWQEMIATAPIKPMIKLALTDAIGLVAAYMPQPEDSLTPLAKKIIKAVIRGAINGIDIALSEKA